MLYLQNRLNSGIDKKQSMSFTAKKWGTNRKRWFGGDFTFCKKQSRFAIGRACF